MKTEKIDKIHLIDPDNLKSEHNDIPLTIQNKLSEELLLDELI